jgi:hypothetical protein
MRWTETVTYVRAWDGERFISLDEEPAKVECCCGECRAEVPPPEPDLIEEAIND